MAVRGAPAGLGERCEIIAGDAFTAVPQGGDAYLLSRVIHDWDEERSVALLTNCRHAMAAQGKLLLIERVLPSRVAPSSMAQALVLSDLNMMVMNGGRERTEVEYQTLCAAAGLRLTQIISTSSPMSVIESVRV